ncbi:hypothetical protein [Persephonella sp.]
MANAVKELDVRFVELPYRCRCGKESKEVVIVANNVGVLDTRCDNCGRRIVETRIVENEKVEN